MQFTITNSLRKPKIADALKDKGFENQFESHAAAILELGFPKESSHFILQIVI